MSPPGAAPVRYVATIEGQARHVEVRARDGRYQVVVDSEVLDVDARRTGPGAWSLLVDGASHVAIVSERSGAWLVDVDGEAFTVEVEEAARHRIRAGSAGGGGAGVRTLAAPLPGKVVEVAVRAGDVVAAGDTLVVIEAMKMENQFKADGAAVVTDVRVQAGQPVNAGDVLLVLGPPPGPAA